MTRRSWVTLVLWVATIAVIISTVACSPPAPAIDNGKAQSEAAGRAVYDGTCATCHKLGAYDTVGVAPDLAGKGDRLVNDLSAISPAMTGFTLTDDEIVDLDAWLSIN